MNVLSHHWVELLLEDTLRLYQRRCKSMPPVDVTEQLNLVCTAAVSISAAMLTHLHNCGLPDESVLALADRVRSEVAARVRKTQD